MCDGTCAPMRSEAVRVRPFSDRFPTVFRLNSGSYFGAQVEDTSSLLDGYVHFIGEFTAGACVR